MGYLIDQTDSSFRIRRGLEAECLKAIKALAGKETIHDASGGHFAWVNPSDFTSAKNLDEAFDAWRYQLSRHSEGYIDGIEFCGEKYGDDEILFKAIAPYVDSGSFIEFKGEDGAQWRWVFKDNKVKKVRAKVSWDEG